MTNTSVFFADSNATPMNNMLDRLEKVIRKTGLLDAISPDDVVMVKTHFGVWGNTRHIRPEYIRKAVEIVKESGGKPFVSETCALGYGTSGPYGGRCTMADYLRMAEKNGFSQGTIGAPIVFADGYWGVNTYDVNIDGDYIKTVPVASALLDCDHVLVLSHAKFHGMGIAATLKNIGVGLVGKGGKMSIHSPDGITLNPSECKGVECSLCVDYCPARCITVNDTVSIDMDKCVRCGHCASICGSMAKSKAITMDWIGQDITKRVVENAMGVVSSIGLDRFYFVNLAIDITEKCDCISVGRPLLMHDIGIFGARDPVAIDHATLEIMKDATISEDSPAADSFSRLVENSASFFTHAKKMNFGTTDYDFVNVPQ
jgi:hypothetical protein